MSRTTMMSDVSKRDIAFLFFKRKNQILVAFAATVALATFTSYVGPRSYDASATVYVVRNLPPIAATGPTSLNQVLDRREVLNSEVDLITSRAVAEQVAEELGLGKDSGRPKRQPGAFVAAVRAVPAAIREALLKSGLIDPPGDQRSGIVPGLLSGLSVAPALNSNFITISFRGDSPDYAARVVNAFTKVYLERRLSLLKRPGLESFYEQQIVRARTELLQVESELNAMKGKTGVVSADEQLRLALEEQSRLDGAIRDVQSVRAETEQRMASLQKRIESQPDSVVSSRLTQRSPELAALDRRRLELEAERAVELNRFSENSAPIQEIDRSIARIKETIAKEPQTVVSSESVAPNGIRATLQTDLFRAESDHAAAEAREIALLARRAAAAAEVRRLDQDSGTVRRIAEAATAASRTYETYVRQKEEARMSSETDPGVTNVQVVSAAAPPTRPVYPRLLEVILGAALGLILGIGYAFLAEIFSQTLERRDDIERELDLPVLASIPYVSRKQLSLP